MVDTLFDDWFGERDQESFVHRDELRSGWDAPFSLTGYSRFLTKKVPVLDLLKTAYNLGKNRISAMLPGRSVPLTFKGDESYTNGKAIVISTDVADQKAMSVYQKLDVLLGLVTHEIAHLLYTDFDEKFSRDDFQHTVHNILEDERIEYLTGKANPGYGAFLEKLKEYYFDFKHRKKDFSSPGKEAFDCFFKFVRYPKYIDCDVVEKHRDILTQVKEIITPYPLEFNACFEASCKIADLFEKHFMESFEEKNPGASKTEKHGAVQEILEQICEQLKDLNSTTANSNDVASARILLTNPLAMKIIKGEVEKGSDSSQFFIKAEDDKTGYLEVKRKVMPAAKSLARVIAIDQYTDVAQVRGMRNGVLDTGKIVEAYLGKPNVYLQQVDRDKECIDIVLMIDESGSMGVDDKIQHAKEVAILFNEALNLVPQTNLFIYGFTSDLHERGDDVLTIYKEQGFTKVYSIGSIESKSNNRDGRCIRAVIDRVIKKGIARKKLLFVISDGQPHGTGYFDMFGIQDTRQAVDYAREKGFLPIQIGIDVDTKVQALMFEDYINYQDANTMVSEIGKLLRRKMQVLRAA